MATQSAKSARKSEKPTRGTPPSTYTPTIYHQLAKTFMEALDNITPAIPQPQRSHIHTLDYLRSYLNVPDAFLSTAVFAVADTPALQAVQKLNVPEGHDTLQFIEAFRPVFIKMKSF
ncbi:MAG: hypothetical protein ACJ74H_18425 [Thermoanaerobaculia bacterium]